MRVRTMTHFACYSTKGIQKPPCEATLWSELAPPAAANHSAASASEAKSTPKGKEKKQKTKLSVSDEAAKHVTASTGKKKDKKKGAKHMSLPEASTADFDGLAAMRRTGIMNMKYPAKMKGKKLKGGDKEVESNFSVIGQSAKKKKNLVMDPGTDDVEGHQEDSAPAADVSEQTGETRPSKKGMKRNGKESGLPKHKKKNHPGNDNVAVILSDASEDHQPDNASQQPASNHSKSTPEKLNGRGGPLQKRKQQTQQQKPGVVSGGPPLLAEGPLVTQFEGYWVRRRAVPRLQRVRDELAAAISDPQTLKREMKKRKRAEHRLLLSQLAARSGRQPTSAAARLQSGQAAEGQEEGAEDMEEAAEDGEDAAEGGDRREQAEFSPRRKTVADDRNPPDRDGPPKEERMVKFDGVWMTGDAVGRLKELRRQLKQQRVSDMVLRQTMKTARRREEMKRKRDAKRVCLGCRQPGHFVSDCPLRVAGANAPVTGLCFRCGSTEHRLSECRRQADGGKLPYAVCFVCGKTGHLSRDCTLNPNGVYPKGGACKVCHQRTHLADDCPERRDEEAASTAPRLATLTDGGALEDDYQHDFRAAPAAAAAAAGPAARTPRLVKF